eukprot:5851942-Prorocentrum_lima.AAC.1
MGEGIGDGRTAVSLLSWPATIHDARLGASRRLRQQPRPWADYATLQAPASTRGGVCGAGHLGPGLCRHAKVHVTDGPVD